MLAPGALTAAADYEMLATAVQVRTHRTQHWGCTWHAGGMAVPLAAGSTTSCGGTCFDPVSLVHLTNLRSKSAVLESGESAES